MAGWFTSIQPMRKDRMLMCRLRNKKNYDVLLMNSPIDNHFIHHLEMKLDKVSLKRVDADVMDKLIEKEDTAKHELTEEETKKLKEIFEKAINNPNMKVEVES